MANITIDDVTYDLDTLPENVKGQVNNLQATEAELARQQALVSMLKAARLKYQDLLKIELQKMDKEDE
jgi:hypothetical protein